MRPTLLPTSGSYSSFNPVVNNVVKVPGDKDIFPTASFDDDEDDVIPEEASETTSDESSQPDTGVFEFYEELLSLQSNPLGLEHFSREEKLHIQLLDVLKEIKAPLTAFSLILNWAASSNDCGYHFKAGCRENLMQNLFTRYNMKGLKPKGKHLYLPYSKRLVSMVYFDASQVFASLLLCPTLYTDKNFMFHGARDPFAEPSRSACPQVALVFCNRQHP